MIKFKTAIVTNMWKGKRVPWTMVHPIPGRFANYEAPVGDVELEIESGPDASRMTATRVITGGVLLGPVGLLLGGMARKADKNNNLVITFPDGVVRIPFSTKDWRAVQQFIEAVMKLQK